MLRKATAAARVGLEEPPGDIDDDPGDEAKDVSATATEDCLLVDTEVSLSKVKYLLLPDFSEPRRKKMHPPRGSVVSDKGGKGVAASLISCGFS